MAVLFTAAFKALNIVAIRPFSIMDTSENQALNHVFSFDQPESREPNDQMLPRFPSPVFGWIRLCIQIVYRHMLVT